MIMNSDLFNDLMTSMSAVLGTFRSPETFPSNTVPLLKVSLNLIATLKKETPSPSHEELDAFIDLETRLLSFSKAIPSYGRDMVLARMAFKKPLRDLLEALDLIAASNPAYGSWLRNLPGYELLRKMVGA